MIAFRKVTRGASSCSFPVIRQLDLKLNWCIVASLLRVTEKLYELFTAYYVHKREGCYCALAPSLGGAKVIGPPPTKLCAALNRLIGELPSVKTVDLIPSDVSSLTCMKKRVKIVE